MTVFSHVCKSVNASNSWSLNSSLFRSRTFKLECETSCRLPASTCVFVKFTSESLHFLLQSGVSKLKADAHVWVKLLFIQEESQYLSQLPLSRNEEEQHVALMWRRKIKPTLQVGNETGSAAGYLVYIIRVNGSMWLWRARLQVQTIYGCFVNTCNLKPVWQFTVVSCCYDVMMLFYLFHLNGSVFKPRA